MHLRQNKSNRVVDLVLGMATRPGLRVCNRTNIPSLYMTRHTNPSLNFAKITPFTIDMITEAITTLKDRSGSSQLAISKFIEAKYKELLPPNFKKTLSVQLKKFVKSEKLVKFNNSYKIPNSVKDGHKKKMVKNVTTKTVTTSKVAAKKITKKAIINKKGVEKAAKMKRLSQIKTPEVLKKKVSIAAGKSGEKMKRLSQVKTS